MNNSIALTDIEKFNLWHGNEFNEFKDIPQYRLKIRTFANNTVDYIVSKTNFKGFTKEKFTGFAYMHPKTKTDEEIEQARLENIERSARRAKQAVHHLVRSMGADHMLTLSTRENITDLKQFEEIFQKFIRLVREKDLINGKLFSRDFNRNYPYVAVRELQERGALHMHIACVGKQDIPLLRACWYVALGGYPSDKGESVKGQIDVQSNVKRFSGQSEVFKTMKLVQYLTKYITKTFETDQVLGKARYKASRQIPRPNVQKQYLQAYFSSGDKTFLDAMTETISIAEFHGVKDFQLWNRGQDIFILRGSI